jgi:hypothetical protein
VLNTDPVILRRTYGLYWSQIVLVNPRLSCAAELTTDMVIDVAARGRSGAKRRERTSTPTPVY